MREVVYTRAGMIAAVLAASFVGLMLGIALRGGALRELKSGKL